MSRKRPCTSSIKGNTQTRDDKMKQKETNLPALFLLERTHLPLIDSILCRRAPCKKGQIFKFSLKIIILSTYLCVSTVILKTKVPTVWPDQEMKPFLVGNATITKTITYSRKLLRISRYLLSFTYAFHKQGKS